MSDFDELLPPYQRPAKRRGPNSAAEEYIAGMRATVEKLLKNADDEAKAMRMRLSDAEQKLVGLNDGNSGLVHQVISMQHELEATRQVAESRRAAAITVAIQEQLHRLTGWEQTDIKKVGTGGTTVYVMYFDSWRITVDPTAEQATIEQIGRLRPMTAAINDDGLNTEGLTTVIGCIQLADMTDDERQKLPPALAEQFYVSNGGSQQVTSQGSVESFAAALLREEVPQSLMPYGNDTMLSKRDTVMQENTIIYHSPYPAI